MEWTAISGVPEIDEWARLVETGEVPACQEQVLLMAYLRRVFETENVTVDAGKLARFMGYRDYFPFPFGPEEDFLTALWLCCYGEDGLPRWPDLLSYVGRGFGKTTLMAFWAFCLLSPANGIRQYDVDVCATTETQAQLSFDDLWNMLEAEPEYWDSAFTWNKEEIYNRETRARFKYWSGNSGSKDGMRSGCVMFDEIHAYRDSASMEVFTGGLGKKDDPRRLFCTTDGDIRDGVLDEKKEQAQAILRDGEPDNGLLPFICKLDSRAEIDDEAAWPKANPRLLMRPQLMGEYRREVAEWRRHPEKHTATPTKRFNLPEARTELPVASWDDLTACLAEVPDLRGVPCVVGIDFAKTTDMVSVCALWRVGDQFYARHHSWICAESRDIPLIKAPIAQWATVDVVDAAEVDARVVADWIADLNMDSLVEAVALDDYRYALVKRELELIGFSADPPERTVRLVRPSDIMRAQPVIDAALATHRIAWGDDPCLRWMANNTMLVPAPNGNYKYGKIDRRSRKNDGFMAMVAAFTIADRVPEYAGAVYAEPLIIS